MELKSTERKKKQHIKYERQTIITTTTKKREKTVPLQKAVLTT